MEISRLNTPSPGDVWLSKHGGYVIVEEVSKGIVRVRFLNSGGWTWKNENFLALFKFHQTLKTNSNTNKLKQE